MDTPNVSPTASISTNYEEILNLRKPLDQGFRHIIATVEQACMDKIKIENFTDVILKKFSCTAEIASCLDSMDLISQGKTYFN